MTTTTEGLYFPKEFLWGASTSSYQIEGYNRFSDLWEWERRKSWSPSLACANSWELWQRDVECLKGLGANAYHFSVEWGRLFPEPGKLDERALRGYELQIDALRAAGITPILCLHHFTHPAWFWSLHPDGWGDEEAVRSFLRFVEEIATAFRSKVRHWIVFNEPMVGLFRGYVTGYFPPGKKSIIRLDLNPPGFQKALLGVASAHRQAYKLIQSACAGDPGGRRCLIGVAHSISHVEPARDSPEDARAASRWDQFFHWNLLDALEHGSADFDLDGEAESSLGRGSTLDFIGINYYSRVFVRRAPLRGSLQALPLYLKAEPPFGWVQPWIELLGAAKADRPRDAAGREVYPEGIASVVRAAHARYGLPILVTENGAAGESDALRDTYLLGHLAELAKAGDTVPTLGYLYWSLIDNYQWGTFRPRYGLYKVHFKDGFKRERTPLADSYQNVIAAWRRAHGPVLAA